MNKSSKEDQLKKIKELQDEIVDSVGDRDMDNLINKIGEWAVERNLHTADPTKQMLKLMEEIGELAEGLAKGRLDQVVDGIGDSIVVLKILSMQMKVDIKDCIAQAYDEIKDRKGIMINGVFVKESDLKDV